MAVLLNKVVLEYIPKYGQRLADEVRKWGQWIKEQAEKELAEFYPKDPDGATPIAYLWARTITCEGPGCGAEVPLMRSLWLAKKANKSVALKIVPNPKEKRVEFEIIKDARAKDVGEGTAKRGSANCPCCGFTTPVKSVREQLKNRSGGAANATLFCVVTTAPNAQGRSYRLPTKRDLQAATASVEELEKRKQVHNGPLSLVPNEAISPNELRRISVPIYGMSCWGDLFSPRQLLGLSTLSKFVSEAGQQSSQGTTDGLGEAVQCILALALDKQADLGNALCAWEPIAQCPRHLFGRQAIGMVWDFAEGVPIGESSRRWLVQVERTEHILEEIGSNWQMGQAQQLSATSHPFPDHSVSAVITDPPYYDAVPYAYLSDFFYVWLRRTLGNIQSPLLGLEQVPKDAEIVVDRPHELSKSNKGIAFYERELTKAFGEGQRILRPDGVAVIVFASKTTASWEAILKAVVDAGWAITGSWPIDTEMASKLAGQGHGTLGFFGTPRLPTAQY